MGYLLATTGRRHWLSGALQQCRCLTPRGAGIADPLTNRVSIDIGGMTHKYGNRRFEKVISETNF
jgi:hypothetical protein